MKMHFRREQMHKIWLTLLEWEDISDAQFCYSVNLTKGTIETFTYFVVAGGTRVRLDLELSLFENEFSTEYIYNWTDKDLNHFIELIKLHIGFDLEDWQYERV